MRNIKILGLGLLAAMAAMAIMGAGTASATKLCSVNTSPCPAGNTYGKGTSIKTQLVAGTKSVMTSGFVTITCTESSMNGKTTSEAVRVRSPGKSARSPGKAAPRTSAPARRPR